MKYYLKRTFTSIHTWAKSNPFSLSDSNVNLFVTTIYTKIARVSTNDTPLWHTLEVLDNTDFEYHQNILNEPCNLCNI